MRVFWELELSFGGCVSALPTAKEMLMLGARNSEAAGKGARSQRCLCSHTSVSLAGRGRADVVSEERRRRRGQQPTASDGLGGLRTPYLLGIAKRRKLEREKKQPELNTCRRKKPFLFLLKGVSWKSLGVDLGSLGL